MKKFLCFFVVLSFLSSALYSQGLDLGIKAGANFANFTGGDLKGYDFNSITSYHAGFVAELNLFDNFSIQPELLYSTQGSNIHRLDQQIKNELGYISIPVLLKFYLTQNKLSLELGPQASFLVTERNKVDTKDTNSFDFGVAVGLGFKFTQSIFIQARYVLGLTEVSRDTDVKNSLIQVSLGCFF